MSTWDPTIIADLLARAESGLISEAKLTSAREAELFRYAIYNHRREKGIGLNLTISIVGENNDTVAITRQAFIQVKET